VVEHKKNCSCKKNELEQRLIENEEKFRLLMELATDGVLVVQDGKIKEVNYYLAKMCGYAIDEVLDTDLASFFHPDDIETIEKIYEKPLKDDSALAVHELTLMCKNGQRVEAEVIAGRFIFQNKPSNLLVVRDISERNRTERELVKARQLESIAALSGGIAHDYNNLLTAIIGNITLAQTYLDPDDKVFLLLNQALAASQTAKDLTQKLITFSKGGAPDKKVADVAKLVKNTSEFTLSGSNLKCEYQFAENLLPVEVDSRQVGQAIHNVIMNAREAMPQGGPLTVSVQNIKNDDDVPSLKNGKYVKISVTDRGNGIPKKNLDRIFNPYFSTKQLGDKKGTGLGLSICHSIIKKHGGNVTVESTYNKGATFHLYLPCAKGKAPDHQDSAKSEQEIPIFGEGRILVMDDEAMIRKLAGELLTYLGYTVDFASNGTEAVKRFKKALDSKAPFDAVILDLTVKGGMGGKKAIQELAKIDPHVVGIVSSGYSNDPVMAEYERHGFKGVVTKPYTMGELGEKLNQVLMSSQN
ncbi:MAG: ATP-binding protein, partial [Desulfobacterales bacterium]|jgi:PAS domain S-box-containing protein